MKKTKSKISGLSKKDMEDVLVKTEERSKVNDEPSYVNIPDVSKQLEQQSNYFILQFFHLNHLTTKFQWTHKAIQYSTFRYLGGWE